jgi:N-acyl homoserine lactone hydrolase
MGDFSMWVLEYARSTNVISYGLYGERNRVASQSYNYTVIRGNGHCVIVDVGIGPGDAQRKMAAACSLSEWQEPGSVLAEIGLAPDDIDTALITHAHFDHMGNLGAFGNSAIYVQEREITGWLQWLDMGPRFSYFAQFVDPANLSTAMTLEREGRLTLVDGDMADVVPGVDLHSAPETHTFGSMWISVKEANPADSWVIAGDNVTVYGNLEGIGRDGVFHPIGYATGSQVRILMSYQSMLSEVHDRVSHVIPGHDSALSERFPSRITSQGLTVTQLALRDGATSYV